jgi:hypothetical protein
MASGMTTFMVEVGGVSLVPATTARRRLEPIAVAAVTVGQRRRRRWRRITLSPRAKRPKLDPKQYDFPGFIVHSNLSSGQFGIA